MGPGGELASEGVHRSSGRHGLVAGQADLGRIPAAMLDYSEAHRRHGSVMAMVVRPHEARTDSMAFTAVGLDCQDGTVSA
ncbi:hypothetical protein E2562_037589 [Oryza meyeriana var. granulata]|uniref:Uncharacterized protein n=1 Tax=Oryza meyeriana var. granulata TaxID=110450 RepID=A0A6G1E717_9ORYZ|nr:hypothetical protein E2562_037589 [Oryza meyeriana var. granulata]